MSNEIYHKNLNALKDRFPAVYDRLGHGSTNLLFPLKSFTTKCGQVNAFAMLEDGRRISFYKEDDIISGTEELMADWHLAAQDVLFCVGLGLGYYPLVAAKKFVSRPHIVAIEPRVDVLELALRSIDLTPLLKYSRLELFVGDGVKASDIIDRFNFKIFLGKQRVVTHMPSRIVFGESFHAFENEIKESIGLAKDLWYTTNELGREMLANMMSNLPGLFSSSHLGRVRGALSGVPAVCIAAGPSLDKAIPLLKKLQDTTLLVSMDSAISTLIRTGIKPHMVVTCDTRKENFEKLRPYMDVLGDAILIFALESNPDNVRVFPSPRRLAVAGDNSIVKSWLAPAVNIDCSLPSISTVSHAAIFSLMELGADPIVLVGMDMAFPEEKSHSEYAVHHYNLNSAELIDIQGVKGTITRTYRPLIDYKHQLERIISKSSCRFINTSLDGIFINGTQTKMLEEVVATVLKDSDDIGPILAGITWEESLAESEVIAALASIRANLESFKDQCMTGIAELEAALGSSRHQKAIEVWKKHLDAARAFQDNFQKCHSMFIDILFSIRLEKIRELEIRRLSLQNDFPAQADIHHYIEELRIIRDDFVSLHEVAQLFDELLKMPENLYRRIQALGNDIPMTTDDQARLLTLAAIYSEAGETMQAVRLYRRVLDKSPENIDLWVDLARLYVAARLWKKAHAHIRKALRLFPGSKEIAAMKNHIEGKIGGIMSAIKAAWGQGDREQTRRLLNEYLLFFPQDEQALLLKKALMEMETALAAERPIQRQTSIPEKQFEERLAKAGRYLEMMEFEQAIGIIEGLIESFPGKAAVLREKIGDCRMLQKDFESAVFNYEQSLSRGHRTDDIGAKIRKARQELGDG